MNSSIRFFSRSIALFIFASIPVIASAGPGMIQYQGRLTNSAGNPITIATNIKFTFYSAANGGTQLGGTFSDTDTVTPNSQGLYSTMIGDEPGTKIPDAVFTSPQVWLNVQIGSENLTPRKQMVATGYAFQSNWATTATTALSSRDTLASVTARGASTASQVTLSGGVKAGKISPLGPGGSVQVEGVYMVGGGIALPAVPQPADPSNRIYQTSGTLFYGGNPVMLKQGSAYIIVQTTANPVTNGANLVSTYNTAKALKPHGQDLATSNRLTVLIPPGRYDLTAAQLVLDTEFIDVIGLSTSRADQYLHGTMNNYNSNLVRQTANNVHIENLFMEATYTPYSSIPPAAYKSDNSTTYTVIRNCEFSGKGWAISTAVWSNFAGYYENCTAGLYGFGYMAVASGTFVKCTAGELSFGCYNRASGTFIDCVGGDSAFGRQGQASGTFIRCKGGNYSFGYKALTSGTFTDCAGGGQCFGSEGTAGGKFDRCTAGEYSFGYLGTASGKIDRCTADSYSFGYKGTASGTFNDCIGKGLCFGTEGTASGIFNGCTSGEYSFGYQGTASGTFKNCAAGDSSFGSYGTASGKFINCTGGVFCFGFAATANGSFTGCIADSYSFGTGDYDTAATASGTFTNCVGGGCCFGAGGGGTTIITLTNGTFTNCVGGGHSFGGQYANNSAAHVKDCRMTENVWYGTWAGQMENCRWATGVNCAETARIYNSTFIGTLNLVNTAAGVTQSRAKSITNAANNVFGATNAAAFNVSNANVQ